MAASDVFLDTAGFLALWDAADEHHTQALRLQEDLTRSGRRFLTTDYVIDETVTLLLVRHSHAAASDFLRSVMSSESVQHHWVTADRFHTAADFFARHDDKEWSFTDCVSFALMHELNVRDSFTTDRHFRQAGFNPLLEKRRR
jgi:predicted nucleic acid-binding protein